MNESQKLEELRHLAEDNGYLDVTRTGPDTYAGIKRLMFHYTLFSGVIEFTSGWENHWCYVDYAAAKVALVDWQAAGWVGEPEGWHRNPRTGRRRANGDPATEYIAD